MKWLVLVLLAGCTFWDFTKPHHHTTVVDPITPDADLGPVVHCGTMVMTDQACQYQVDNICEYGEGIDGGVGGPYTRCRCRNIDRWYCYQQPYPTCDYGVTGGAACMAGAPTCEFEIEADAGPEASYICNCVDGTWSCQI
jgi:hypothetical protein